MTKGLKSTTPIQNFIIQDYGIVNIKLTPDEQNIYFYYTQSLYEFTSPFGFELNVLIMINNEKITYTFPFLIRIKKSGDLLYLYDISGAEYAYQKILGQNAYYSKDGYSSIELNEKQKCILTQNNNDQYEFTYNSIDETYELSKIYLKSTNDSETTINKENGKTIIKNNKNIDIVEIENTLTNCYVRIKRKEKVIKIYQFTNTNENKILNIKYKNENKEGNQNTYINQEITLQNNVITLKGKKENITINYYFNLNENYKIKSYHDQFGNSVYFEYEPNYIKVDYEYILNYKYYEIYYDDYERLSHMVDTKKEYFIEYIYDEKNMLISTNGPFYYNQLDKNGNYIKSRSTIQQTSDVTYKKEYTYSGKKGDIITIYLNPNEAEVISLACGLSYKGKDEKPHVVGDPKIIKTSISAYPHYLLTFIMPEDYLNIDVELTLRIENQEFDTVIELFNKSISNKINYNEDGFIDSFLTQNMVTNFIIENKKIVKTPSSFIEYDGNYVKKIENENDVIESYDYDVNNNLTNMSMAYNDEKQQMDYEYDENHQIIREKNPKNPNVYLVNTYYENSALKTSRLMKGNTYQAVTYNYPLNLQPYVNEIVFESNNTNIKRNFSYENEEIHTINGDCNLTFNYNENNDLIQFINYNRSCFRYTYHKKGNVLTSLIATKKYEGSDVKFYFNYDESFKHIASISYSDNNNENEKTTLASFTYANDENIDRITYPPINLTFDSECYIKFYYTLKKEIYKAIQVIGSEKLSTYASQDVLQSINTGIIKQYSNKIYATSESINNELRSDLRNIKVCDFKKDIAYSAENTTKIIAYNYYIPVNYMENDSQRAFYYVGYERPFSSQYPKIENIDGLSCALLSDVDETTNKKRFTNYLINLGFSFTNNTSPFISNSFSFLFMCKFKKLTKYKTILARLMVDANNVASGIKDDLFITSDYNESLNEITISLCQGVLALGEGGHGSVIYFKDPICKIILSADMNLWYMIGISIADNEACLFVNKEVSVNTLNIEKFTYNHLLFGVRMWHSEANQNTYLNKNFESQFYITNIVMPYKCVISKEEMVSLYNKTLDALNKKTYSRTYISKCDKINANIIEYISLNKSIISNNNLNPVINILESELANSNDLFIYDYKIGRYVLVSGKKELQYENVFKRVTFINIISVDVKLMNMFLSNSIKYPLLEIDSGNELFLQLLSNSSGDLYVSNFGSRSEQLIGRGILNTEEYVNLKLKIVLDTLYIYYENKSLYSCKISFNNTNITLKLGNDYESDNISGTRYMYKDVYFIARNPNNNELVHSTINIQNSYNHFNSLCKSKISVDKQDIVVNHFNINEELGQIESSSISLKEENYQFNYQYSLNNLLTSIKTSFYHLNEEIAYSYDELNRLISEKKDNKLTKYTYDKNGNIISINKDNQVINFIYDAGNRLIQAGDKVIEYENNTIQYPNKIGNNELSWLGNRLISLKTNNNEIINYEYNEQGQRILKEIQGYVHYYFYENELLVLEVIKNTRNETERKEINYLYDENQNIFAIIYDDKRYYYLKDAFNNIIDLIDEEGQIVCKYEYNAYGEILLITDGNGNIDTSNNSIGHLNPFRYKGYYYDEETQLFYCNSRYYSPELCRWISPDSIEYLDPSSINGLNLYCYCYNDPVNYYDPSGHFAISTLIILGLIAVGAVVGGTVAGVNSYNNGNRGWELVGDVLGGALIGGAIGGIVGYFAAPGIAAMLSSTGTIGGALAFAGGMGSTGAGIAISSVGQLALAGAVTSVGVLSGITVMAAQTRKSGGYYGERWPGDPHKPDHVHLRGNGIDIRIGRDGKPLPGEDKLGSQARKALERLWDEFVKLFNRW